ncbi:MAG: sn-glycerol-3-phosphate ABC transporter ATP-binding protein UgpC [Chloroflexia bacterium]|nr:sn-glycerol-3-phosphate ABC transporter ATP-binding protein UgpC [Chloroflexia bacterium]
MAEIRLEGITKIFDNKVRAVNNVSLTIADQEFMVLLGPSGCGKTTLMRMTAGLEYPEAGDILIGGRNVTDLPPRKRDIAMVFQSYAVFPHLSVFENIAFGLRMRRIAKGEVQRRVEESAKLVELSPYLERFPAQLSGGQRQRVAVARAIVMEPAVLLMDEPLSNLDALLRLNFRAELKRLVRELRTTTIYVTHDQVEALSLGDRIAIMREGQIVQIGTPTEVYDRPASEFVGGFIGSPPMNFLNGRLERRNGTVSVIVGEHALAAPAWLATRAGDEILVGIRAENIEAEERDTPGSVVARTEVVEPLGSHLLVTTVIGEQRVKVIARADAPIKPDDQLWLRPEPDKLRWFDRESGLEIAV